MSRFQFAVSAMKLRPAMTAVWTVIITVMLQHSYADAQENVRIAVFKGKGVGLSVKQVLQTLDHSENNWTVSRITAEQIRSGELDAIDVLIHPGGSGRGQARALGEAGREKIRNYISDGGGYLGICAGSYLATNDYSWSLNLIDAKVVDRRHWNREKARSRSSFRRPARHSLD